MRLFLLSVLLTVALASAPQWPAFTGKDAAANQFAIEATTAVPSIAHATVYEDYINYYPGGLVLDTAGNGYASAYAWLIFYAASNTSFIVTPLTGFISTTAPLLTNDGQLLILQGSDLTSGQYAVLALNVSTFLRLVLVDNAIAVTNSTAWLTILPNASYPYAGEGWSLTQLSNGLLATADASATFWLLSPSGAIVTAIDTQTHVAINSTAQGYNGATAPPQTSAAGDKLFYLRNDGYYFVFDTANYTLSAYRNLNDDLGAGAVTSTTQWGANYPLLVDDISYIFVYSNDRIFLTAYNSSLQMLWLQMYHSSAALHYQQPLLYNESVIILVDTLHGPRLYNRTNGAILRISAAFTGITDDQFNIYTQPIYNSVDGTVYLTSDDTCRLLAYNVPSDTVLWSYDFSQNVSQCGYFEGSNLAVDAEGRFHILYWGETVQTGYIVTDPIVLVSPASIPVTSLTPTTAPVAIPITPMTTEAPIASLVLPSTVHTSTPLADTFILTPVHAVVSTPPANISTSVNGTAPIAAVVYDSNAISSRYSLWLLGLMLWVGILSL